MRDGRWEIGDERLEIGAVRRETGDAVMRRQVQGLQTSEMLGIPVILLLHHLTMRCLKKNSNSLSPSVFCLRVIDAMTS